MARVMDRQRATTINVTNPMAPVSHCSSTINDPFAQIRQSVPFVGQRCENETTQLRTSARAVPARVWRVSLNQHYATVACQSRPASIFLSLHHCADGRFVPHRQFSQPAAGRWRPIRPSCSTSSTFAGGLVFVNARSHVAVIFLEPLSRLLALLERCRPVETVRRSTMRLVLPF